MVVRVESIWSGGDRYGFRLSGAYRGKHFRFQLSADSWNRRTASEALDLLDVELPGVARRSIRFSVK